jgi:hypothetical protein
MKTLNFIVLFLGLMAFVTQCASSTIEDRPEIKALAPEYAYFCPSEGDTPLRSEFQMNLTPGKMYSSYIYYFSRLGERSGLVMLSHKEYQECTWRKYKESPDPKTYANLTRTSSFLSEMSFWCLTFFILLAFVRFVVVSLHKLDSRDFP